MRNGRRKPKGKHRKRRSDAMAYFPGHILSNPAIPRPYQYWRKLRNSTTELRTLSSVTKYARYQTKQNRRNDLDGTSANVAPTIAEPGRTATEVYGHRATMVTLSRVPGTTRDRDRGPAKRR